MQDPLLEPPGGEGAGRLRDGQLLGPILPLPVQDQQNQEAHADTNGGKIID